MKATIVILFLFAVVTFLTCTLEPEVTEKISTPATPAGDATADRDEVKTYNTSGSRSNLDHPIEYRFDLDADGSHRYTAWSPSDSVTASWSDSSIYAVKAQARCSIHRGTVSSWSLGKMVGVAMVPVLPQMYFATRIDDVRKPYDPSAPLDTVGMFKPFAISYHGSSIYGPIKAYKFFPLTAGIDLPGANEWTTDLSDTLRAFSNEGDEALRSGVFRLAAQCRDVLDLESPVDAGRYEYGVAQVVVNFDPDTKIIRAMNTFLINDIPYHEYLDITDGIPDTVQLYSWVRVDYSGVDDERDGKSCDPSDTDLCVGFQASYHLSSVHQPSVEEYSLYRPRSGVHDTDPFSARDSNTFSIGPFEYELFVRALDENRRPDGTPPHVDIVGNFNPTLDSVVVRDHLNNRIDLSIVDTVTWNFWKGEGWPYLCECDTVDKPETWCFGPQDPPECQFKSFPDNRGTFDYYKSFGVRIKAWGHDHPRDPSGSGVKAWRYMVMNSSGQYINLGRSMLGWFDGVEIDVMNELIRWKVFYPGPLTPNPDPYGDTVMANLPAFLDDDLTFFLMGTDLGSREPPYEQYVFINGQPELTNIFSAYLRDLGRRTQERVFAFRIRLIRP